MSKIKNSGLDQYGLNPSNSSNLEYLALKGLTDSSKFLHRFKAYHTYSYHLSPNVYCYFLRTLVYSACLVKVFCSAWFWKKIIILAQYTVEHETDTTERYVIPNILQQVRSKRGYGW